jgi:3-oxoadipate enol-lactonase
MSSRTSEGIKYWVMGDGPEAVFCHPSLGLGRFLFHRLMPPLSRRYTVVTWDPRGIGDNAGYVPRLTDWVNDVVSMIDEVGKPAHLIGVSLGTWVMPRVALARPETVQKLVMIGATPGFAGGEEQVAARRQEIEQIGMAAFARQYAEGTLAPAADEDMRQKLADSLAECRPDAYLASMREIYLVDNRTIWPNVRQPTLFLVGSRDSRTPPAAAEALAELLPQGLAQVRVIPQAGHLALLDYPDRVYHLIEEFLSRGTLSD